MHVPVKAEVRLNIIDGAGILVIAPEGATPSVEALHQRGGICAVLMHDPGLTWPDKRGVSMVEATLEAGGTAALEFSSIADAIQCQSRLNRERTQ